jgi:hypothetical protein
MSAHDLEPTTPPPGHGEPLPPAAPHRCPECGALVQNTRPATVKEGRAWLGYCPEHGTVRLP